MHSIALKAGLLTAPGFVLATPVGIGIWDDKSGHPQTQQGQHLAQPGPQNCVHVPAHRAGPDSNIMCFACRGINSCSHCSFDS